jgi:hypothetical protein
LGLRTDGYKLFNFNLLDFHLFHAPNGTKVQPAGLAFRAALEARKWDSSSRNVSVDLRIWPAELSQIRDWFPCSSSLAASGPKTPHAFNMVELLHRTIRGIQGGEVLREDKASPADANWKA